MVSVDDPSLLLCRTGVPVGAEKLYLSVAEYESDIWVMDPEPPPKWTPPLTRDGTGKPHMGARTYRKIPHRRILCRNPCNPSCPRKTWVSRHLHVRFLRCATVAELVYAQDLGSCEETHEGSSPSGRMTASDLIVRGFGF